MDANIVLSVVLGRRSRPVFERVATSQTVVTSARAVEEVRGVLGGTLGLPRGASDLAEVLLSSIAVVPEAVYADGLATVARVLARAVASRDASTRDAHLLTLAWTLDADLWTPDRDFASTGWPSWSNAYLLDVAAKEVILGYAADGWLSAEG